MLNGMIYCTSPLATYGLIVRNGVVVETAPIGVKAFKGRPIHVALEELRRRRHTTWHWLPDIDPKAQSREQR